VKSDLLIAVVLLSLSLLLRGVLPPSDADGDLAMEKIGNRQRQRLVGQPAYRHGQAALLFFEERGFSQRFRGAVLIADGFIEDVFILKSVEGLDRRAFKDENFLNSFRGLPAAPPVIVDGIAGATISCRALQNTVNARLRAWQEAGHALR